MPPKGVANEIASHCSRREIITSAQIALNKQELCSPSLVLSQFSPYAVVTASQDFVSIVTLSDAREYDLGTSSWQDQGSRDNHGFDRGSRGVARCCFRSGHRPHFWRDAAQTRVFEGAHGLETNQGTNRSEDEHGGTPENSTASLCEWSAQAYFEEFQDKTRGGDAPGRASGSGDLTS